MQDQHMVGMAQIKAAKGPTLFSCIGLGSCVGVAAFDAVAEVSGMAHIMLPESFKDRAIDRPGKYADTGITALLHELVELGADPARIVMAYAGGAHVFQNLPEAQRKLDVGERNGTAVGQILAGIGAKVVAADVGGTQGRTFTFCTKTGQIRIRTMAGGETAMQRTEPGLEGSSMNGRTITLEQIVKQTADLPSIPAAAIRVMRETERAEASASTVAQHLASDQALSVRVLRLANSPFYGLSRRVGNLSEAVVVLGMRSVKNLALVASTYPWMTRPLPGYGLGPNEMWRHAFATAVGAQHIATLSRKVKDDVAFTAGLLHDIGKVALNVWMENKVQAISFYAQREEIPFDEAERRVLGYDHTQVGEHLAKAWNLPENICDVVRYHHQPSYVPSADPLVDCVHVGDYLAMSMGFGLGGDGLQYPLDDHSMVRLGIKYDDIDRITDSFVDSFEHYESMFGEAAA